MIFTIVPRPGKNRKPPPAEFKIWLQFQLSKQVLREVLQPRLHAGEAQGRPGVEGRLDAFSKNILRALYG